MEIAQTDEEVRVLAGEILSRDEYSRWRFSEEQLQTFFSFLDRISDFLEWFTKLLDVDPVLFWLIWGGLLLIAAILIAHIVWSIRLAMQASVPRQMVHQDESEVDFLGEAAVLAGQGAYLEAAHRVQLATIGLLLKRKAIELSRSETNRVLRRRLATSRLSPADQEEFLALLNTLEWQWFRDRKEDQTLYDAWLGLYSRLETTVATL